MTKIGQPAPASASEELRRAAADLEADLASVLERSARATTLAGECETRAMNAIRNADDNAARLALREHEDHIATVQQLEADANILRAMLAECAVVLDESRRRSSVWTSGELTVGIDDAPPVPLQEGNPQSGDFRGYEVDIVNELARRIGVRVRYHRALWSTIMRELENGAIDAICSAATITPERAELADFCTPHLELTLAVVTRADDEMGTSLADRRVGVRAGTTAEAYARSHGAREPLQMSESNDELYAALCTGSIDAVVDDSPIASHFARAIDGLQFAGRLPDTDAAYAIMVRKGDDTLRSALNGALTAMKDEGLLDTLRERWHLSAQ